VILFNSTLTVRRWPISEIFNIDPKNIADIYYTSRFIANFVPNFVVMATVVGQGKMRLAVGLFDGPSPKTLLWVQKISQKSLTQAEL